jgi:hypothetical protein
MLEQKKKRILVTNQIFIDSGVTRITQRGNM